MPGRPDEILTVGVDLDAKAALRGMQKFQRALKSEMQTIAKTVKSLEKTNSKALQKAVEDSEEWLDTLDDLSVAHDKEAGQLNKIGRQIDLLREKQEKLTGEAKKANAESIKLLEKQAGTLSNRVTAKLLDKAASNKMRANLTEGLKGVVDDVSPIFQSFFSKDLKGMIESGTKGAGKLLGFGLRKGASAAFKGGAALKEKGAAMSQAGAAKGGMGGAAMGAMGSALKGIGGFIGKLGPMISTVAKLGPIMSSIGSVFVGLLKLFVDADAQAKEFNKNMLSTAGTADFLADRAYDAGDAYYDLEDAVNEIRDSAFSLDNLDWGINKDTHLAVLNALNQEGVALSQMRDDAQNMGKTLGWVTAELTHVGVAYSRAFGVPLQEINEMQGQMMTDLGMSVKETRLAFSQMTRSASESGIASNKFFAIIRGISSDLGLYNNRMEDAVKTLRLLGKVMNPREAQKFMSTAMQGMKQMGRQERLRMTLLAGSGKMGKIVNDDIKRKQKGLAKTISGYTKESAEDVENILASGNKKAIAGLVDQLPKGIKGSVREGLMDMDLQVSRNAKGTFGTSGAAAGLSPAASLMAMQEALKGWGGGSTLKEGAGTIGMEMMADNLGISQDQLDQMIKFESSIDLERETLKKGLADGNKEVIDRLSAAGLKTAEDIDAAGYDKIYDAMEESKNEQVKKTQSIEYYAKKQAGLTQSLLDQLETLIDWFMNQLYTVMMDIYDTILDILNAVGMGPDKGLVAAQRELRHVSVGKKELSAAIKDADPSRALSNTRLADTIASVANKGTSIDAAGGLSALQEQLRDLQAHKDRGESMSGDKAWDSGDDQAMKDAQAKLDDATKNMDTLSALWRVADRQYDNADWSSALQQAGVDEGTVKTFQGNKTEWGDSKSNVTLIDELVEQGKITSEQANTALTKLGTWSSASLKEKTLGMGDMAKELKKSGLYTDDEQKKNQETTAEATEELADAGTSPHTLYTKFSDSFLTGKYKRTTEDIMLETLRKALFEYYMYSKMEPSDVAQYLSDNNMSITDFATEVGKQASAGKAPGDWMGGSENTEDGPPADANAAGGLVTSVNGGLATVRAAAGEGLASIGVGERILPAGVGVGGSVTIPINVSGIGASDLARIINAKVIDGIAEYKRRERFA